MMDGLETSRCALFGRRRSARGGRAGDVGSEAQEAGSQPVGRCGWGWRLPVLFVLTAPLLWLCGCANRNRDAEAAYLKAQSALRTGDFRQSLAMAREGLRRWPDGDWGWQFRLVCAEDLIVLSRVKEARALLETVGVPSDVSVQARLKMDRARVALGPQPERAKLMRDALQTALVSRDPALICMARLRLSDLVPSLSEAEAYDRAALVDAERANDPYLLAWARVNLGFHRAQASRFDEAIPFLDRALEGARQCGAKSFLGITLGNLGWCYLMLGDIDRAQDAFTRAEAITGQIGLRDSQHRWLGELGNVYMRRGDLDRAASYQQRAATLAREVGNDAWLAIALTNLAQTSLQKGDPAAAQSFNDKALAIKRRLGDEWSLVHSEYTAAEIDLNARNYERARRGYQAVIERARQAHAPDILWQAHGELALVYQQTGKPKLAEVQFRKAIDTIDSEWDKLNSDDWKTTFLAPGILIGFFQDYVDFLIERGHTEKALEVAESSRARVLNQRLEHRGAVPPNFRIGKLLSAARASHTVILSYLLAKRSSVWVVGSGHLSRFDLPPAKEIAALVGKYTSAITQGGDPLAGNAGVSAALYNAVLAPVAKLIPPGSNVIVVPDGALHQLNFETLVVPGPQPHYWIEDAAVSTAPSLRALTGDGPKPARTPKLLLLGAPVLTGQDFAPLPNVRREIAAIADQFPAANRDVITGAAATPEQYAKAAPASFTNIHFATHATANRESPLNSAIILSHRGERFKLYAREVADVPLTADLVTISACTSAGAKAYSGEGLMGFAWAFLQAGAQNVIASLWDVDDARSVDIMRGLYAGMAAGQSPARALRSAKLAVLHGAGSGRLPYYWGPLEVFTRRIGW
jgi:CHAT domain-containing protein